MGASMRSIPGAVDEQLSGMRCVARACHDAHMTDWAVPVQDRLALPKTRAIRPEVWFAENGIG